MMSSLTSTATLYPAQGFGAPKNRHAHAREGDVGLPAGKELVETADFPSQVCRFLI